MTRLLVVLYRWWFGTPRLFDMTKMGWGNNINQISGNRIRSLKTKGAK
jgi:hypothetical protein